MLDLARWQKGVKVKILIKTVSISDQLFWSAITLGVFWSREQNGLNMRIVTAVKHAIPHMENQSLVFPMT